jgi:hypothetical protein
MDTTETGSVQRSAEEKAWDGMSQMSRKSASAAYISPSVKGDGIVPYVNLTSLQCLWAGQGNVSGCSIKIKILLSTACSTSHHVER